MGVEGSKLPSPPQQSGGGDKHRHFRDGVPRPTPGTQVIQETFRHSHGHGGREALPIGTEGQEGGGTGVDPIGQVLFQRGLRSTLGTSSTHTIGTRRSVSQEKNKLFKMNIIIHSKLFKYNSYLFTDHLPFLLVHLNRSRL